MRIYLDNASTTPILPEVTEEMSNVMKTHYGNPSSIHFHGRNSKSLVESARKKVATLFNASIGEIFFTSSASEGNNTVLKNAVESLNVERIISSPTEHHSVFHTLDFLKAHKGTEIIYLDVDNTGKVNPNDLEALLKDESKKTLVSLMHTNNEIGTMQPVETVASLCKIYGAYFHCDAVQSIGKFNIDLSKTRISFITASAHKFHGPKGTGFLYMNSDSIIAPLIHGGAQERNMRAGTENLYGISGLARALEIAHRDMESRKARIMQLRDHFKKRLESEFSDIQFNGAQEGDFLYTVLNVSFPPSPKADMLIFNLDIKGISASSGSACSSGVEQDSHVLRAINHPPERKAIRFSFSHLNTLEEIDTVVEKLKDIDPSIVKQP